MDLECASFLVLIKLQIYKIPCKFRLTCSPKAPRQGCLAGSGTVDNKRSVVLAEMGHEWGSTLDHTSSGNATPVVPNTSFYARDCTKITIE